MRKIITLTMLAMALFFYTGLSNAEPIPVPQQPILNKVMLQVAAEKWVTTTTARVIVSISATLDKKGLADTRSTMMANLNKIAKGEWHITQFNRSQDSSGLETVHVLAEARLDEALLTNLRSSAETVSKPGATYRIDDIDFTPSLADVQKIQEQVRQQLYENIKAEVARLNQTYPDANYSVLQINFLGGFMPQPNFKMAREAVANTAFASEAASISVSNKVSMTATVELAANRK